MNDNSCNLTLLLTSEDELPAGRSVWGTGGWLPPEQREALDWLTLARCLGWDVTILRPATPDLTQALSSSSRVVISGDPDQLSEETVARLTSWLSQKACLLV